MSIYFKLDETKIENIERKGNNFFIIVNIDENIQSVVEYRLGINTNQFAIQLEIYLDNKWLDVITCNTKKKTEEVQDYWLKLGNMEFSRKQIKNDRESKAACKLAEKVFI